MNTDKQTNKCTQKHGLFGGINYVQKLQLFKWGKAMQLC